MILKEKEGRGWESIWMAGGVVGNEKGDGWMRGRLQAVTTMAPPQLLVLKTLS